MQLYNMVLVYDMDYSHVLFCKRIKPPYVGKLNFPGGKQEIGETGREAAYRELYEETGIKLDDITPLIHMIDFTYYNTNHFIEFYFGRLKKRVKLIKEKDGNELEWIQVAGTDFNNTDLFAGDGNVSHCINIVETYRKKNKKIWSSYL